MARFPIEHESDEAFYAASIGAIIGFPVCMMLFIHSIAYYVRNKKEIINKTPYLLVLIYLFFGLLQLFALLFLRTDIITRIHPDDFTMAQCASGFILNWFGTFACVAMLYIICIHRVYIIFKGSIYEYKRGYFIILYTIVAILFFVHASLRYYAYLDNSVMVLAEDRDGHVMFCRNVVKKSLGPVSLVLVVYIIIMSATLLYMFVSRLYAINAQKMKSFVAKVQRLNNIADVPEIGGAASFSASSDGAVSPSGSKPDLATVHSIDIIYDAMKNKSETAKKIMKHDLREIVALHDLIKKQTILASIALVSSTSLWCLVFWKSHFFWEIVWDIAINSICVWLMLKSSKKYWELCIKYGPCICCYRRTLAIAKEMEESPKKEERPTPIDSKSSIADI
eukprot:264317_1